MNRSMCDPIIAPRGAPITGGMPIDTLKPVAVAPPAVPTTIPAMLQPIELDPGSAAPLTTTPTAVPIWEILRCVAMSVALPSAV